MSKIVEAVEAWYRQHGTARVAPSHRPENTSQGSASSGHTWMHVRGPQRSRASPSPRKIGLTGKPFFNHVRLDLPRKTSAHEGVQDAIQPAWNDSGAERW